MTIRNIINIKTSKRVLLCLSLLIGSSSCVQLTETVELDDTLSYTEINGYKFHTETFGSAAYPTVIVVHGGPGGIMNI